MFFINRYLSYFSIVKSVKDIDLAVMMNFIIRWDSTKPLYFYLQSIDNISMSWLNLYDVLIILQSSLNFYTDFYEVKIRLNLVYVRYYSSIPLGLILFGDYH